VSSTAPALLAASAGVGFGHAILPDHWVPLAVLGRTRRYSLSRIARLSTLAGIGHVLLSVVLGGVIIVIGLQFRSAVQSAQDTIIGGLLVATGLGFVILELTGHGHHHDHDHDHDHFPDDDHDPDHDHAHDQRHHAHGAAGAVPEPRGVGLLSLLVPFGAAASPDLTILPVFLAATTAGAATAIGSAVIFAAVTIATFVGLTVAAARGSYEIQGDWLERWGNTITAVVLLVIGGLVLLGII
jgi:nickel/cobalt exporter